MSGVKWSIQKVRDIINSPRWRNNGASNAKRASAWYQHSFRVLCSWHLSALAEAEGVREMQGMGGSAVIAMMLALAGMAATSSAAVYKVGGTSGWTILGNVNYADWAGNNTFHVGDIIGKYFQVIFRKYCTSSFLAENEYILQVGISNKKMRGLWLCYARKLGLFFHEKLKFSTPCYDLLNWQYQFFLFLLMQR
jgi:hypothetical protein